MSSVESDVKRMIQNAKEFNKSGSIVFQNAERIRKMLHNFMCKNNPAHNDPTYQPKATPIPEHLQRIKLKPARSDANLNRRARDVSMQMQERATSGTQTQRSASAAATIPDVVLNPDEEGYEPTFTGKTFQQAQEQIIHEMIKHRDEE